MVNIIWGSKLYPFKIKANGPCRATVFANYFCRCLSTHAIDFDTRIDQGSNYKSQILIQHIFVCVQSHLSLFFSKDCKLRHGRLVFFLWYYLRQNLLSNDFINAYFRQRDKHHNAWIICCMERLMRLLSSLNCQMLNRLHKLIEVSQIRCHKITTIR